MHNIYNSLSIINVGVPGVLELRSARHLRHSVIMGLTLSYPQSTYNLAQHVLCPRSTNNTQRCLSGIMTVARPNCPSVSLTEPVRCWPQEILNLSGQLVQTSSLMFITTPVVGKFAVSESEERQTDGVTLIGHTDIV